MSLNGNKKDNVKAWAVKKVAEMHGVDTSYVYKILNGVRENDEIFSSYMDLIEGSNTLVAKVKELVPFTQKIANNG